MNCLFWQKIAIGLTALLIGISGCGQNNAQSSFPPSKNNMMTEEHLWSQLQQPKTHYFVLMRHAIAPGSGDPENFKLGDCSTQRNLSQEGREQAKGTGEAFKRRNIEVEQVLSSQWCRCLETAELMDIGTVKPFPPLNSFFRDRSTKSEQTAQVREFMLQQTDESGVTVMVTHFVNISALTESGVSSGGIKIMALNRQEELTVVGEIDAL